MTKAKITISTLLSLFLLTSSFASELRKKLDIQIELSPAGSFQIESKRFKGGRITKEGNSFIVENIYVPVKTLKSGMDLRDEHIRTRLQNENIVVVSAKGKDGQGTGVIIIRNIESKFNFTFEVLSENFIKAKFQLSLEDFQVPDLSYMGISVRDKVEVAVTLPFRNK